MKETIGLEVHFELRTNSKMFCGCPADHFQKKPNTQTCPVCLGLPGALPVPNKKAVDWAIVMGLAVGGKINKETKFDRKHYSYPDLPKGYQISQYDEPLCTEGSITTPSGSVGITRVHLEEDTGKLKHRKIKGKNVSLVDFNRSGVPLVEVVTEPDIKSGSQAKEFAQELQKIVRYLGISDCDMEKGSMRLEANTSWGLDMNYKVEVKNLNSFKFVERAIEYDLERQKRIINEGKMPKQETRGWDEKKNITTTQRFKETEADYRYFPEPDIPPMIFTNEYIKRLKKLIPEMPKDKAERFVNKYKIRADYAHIVTSEKQLADFTEKTIKLAIKENIDVNDVVKTIVNQKIDARKKTPKVLISCLKKEKHSKVSDEKLLSEWVDVAMKETPRAVKDYKEGKENAISAIIGKVMQLSSGKADASVVKSLLEKRLKR